MIRKNLKRLRHLKYVLKVKVLGMGEIRNRELSSYLVSKYEQRGWFKSGAIAESIDNVSQPLPWFTYSAISFLGNLDLRELNVFELGAGNSTLWFAKKGANVCSIESNLEFYQHLRKRIPDRVNLIQVENLSTVKELPNYVTNAEIIVIDSTHRVHDAEIISWHLRTIEHKKLDMIIFDNSERYPSLIKSLSEKLNLIQIDFIGLGPVNDYEWSTSILINRNFGIKNNQKFSSSSSYPSHVNNQVSDMDKEIDQEYPPIKSFSLNEIDINLNKIFKNKKNGFYVELGANDGITQSNTFFFEKYLNWTGILIEPFVDNFNKCKVNRSPQNRFVNAACVSNSFNSDTMPLMYSNLMTIGLKGESDILNREMHAKSGSKFINDKNFVFNAPARTLTSILEEYEAPKMIDLLSLDVEGAELEVLKGLDHSKYRFSFICVESRDLNEMKNYLEALSYRLIKSLSDHDYLFEDIS